MSLVPTSGRGSSTGGMTLVSRMIVTITGVSTNGVVMCRDAYGNEFEIDARLRMKGTGWPVIEERWILKKIGNKWALEAMIGAPTPPLVEGDRTGMHPVVSQMLDALDIHGLVRDQTVRDPALEEPVYDNTTDPVTFVAADEEYIEEDDLADEGGGTKADDPAGSDDDPEPGSKVSNDLVSVTSYNMAFWMGNNRCRRDLKRLLDQNDVFGLQECAPAERDPVLADIPSNWGMFRPARPAAGHTNPIYWNKDVFARVDSGTRLMVSFDGPGTLRPARAFNWVLLRHKATNALISFANIHMENGAVVAGYPDPNYKPGSGPRHVERWNQMMPIATEEIKKLLPRGAVMVFGDVNCRARDDLRRRDSRLYTAKWGQMGLRSNWDVLGLLDRGTIGNHGTHFDWFMLANKVPGQVKFVNHKILRGYGSDHRPVRTKIRFKAFT